MPDTGPGPVTRVGRPNNGLDRMPRGGRVAPAVDGEGVSRDRWPVRVGNGPNRVAAPVEYDRDDGANHYLHVGRRGCSRRGRGERRHDKSHDGLSRARSGAQNLDQGRSESNDQDEQRLGIKSPGHRPDRRVEGAIQGSKGP
jgi:hypothetical protein